MSEFTFLTPGTVQHADGWIVRNVGRSLVEHEEAGRVAVIEVERGTLRNTIYPDTLRWTDMAEQELPPAEQQTILARIEEGLRTLSGKENERCPGRA